MWLVVEVGKHFPVSQYTYRSELGSCAVLQTMTNQLQHCIDAGRGSRVVQIDFSSAFDRVNHRGILNKLPLAGVNGRLLSIVIQFICYRQ